MPLDSPTCFKQLQHLEQEGAVQPDLSSFGKKNLHIWSHWGDQMIMQFELFIMLGDKI